MNKDIFYNDLGRRDYKEIWDFQERIFQTIIDVKMENRKQKEQVKTPNYLFFVEHPNVYTLGKSGDIKHLLISEKKLQEKKVDFFKINRGGDITFHGLGQVVAYPILDLDNFFTDIHKYLRLLEEVIIRTLSNYGIKGQRSENQTGVWIDEGTAFARKICAMGIRASRWVTMHGLALNVNTDLSYFNYIVPCGIKDKMVTSMQAELGYEVSMYEVKELIVKHFAELFQAYLIKKDFDF